MKKATVIGSRRVRTGAVILAPLTVAVALWAGAAWGGDDEDREPSAADGTGRAAEVKASYGEALKNFGSDLPDDVEIPPMSERIDALVEKAEGRPVSFQDGFVESQLVGVWRCSWQRSYYNAVSADDAEAKERAATELSKYHDLPAVKKWVSDPDHLWFNAVIVPALKGDIAPLTEDLQINCGAPFAPQ